MMRKITSLLHDVTLLNFPLLVTLVKRYTWVALITPFVVACIGTYVYSSQKIIYQSSIPFIVKIDNEGNSVNDIASLLGEKKKGLSEGDIMAIATNWKFTKKLSQKIIDHPLFDKMHFSDINATKYVSNEILLAGCKEKPECKVERIAGALASFFTIKKTPDENRYILEIKSLSKELNMALSMTLVEMIKINRIETIKMSITEKRTMSEDLIEQKSREFTEKKFDNLVDEKAALEQKVISMRNRLEDIGRSIIQNSMQITSLESKIKHVKNSEQVAITTNDRDKFQRFNTLKNEIQKIREDITVLESNISTGAANATDHYIITELQKSLAKKNKEISILEKDKTARGIAGKDIFADGQEKSELYLDLDYKVKKEEIKKMEMEQKELEKNLKNANARISEISNIITNLNPDREYLKLLEMKVVSLKLVENTITSDLEFDAVNPVPSSFLRASLGKIFMFSLTASLVLVMVLVIIIYLFDDKIYDENELALAFDELKVIGQTPKFDQF